MKNITVIYDEEDGIQWYVVPPEVESSTLNKAQSEEMKRTPNRKSPD